MSIKRFLNNKWTPVYALLFFAPTPMLSYGEAPLGEAELVDEHIVLERRLGRILNPTTQVPEADLALQGQRTASLDQWGASAQRWTIGPLSQEGCWLVTKPTHGAGSLTSHGLREIYLKKGMDSYEILVELRNNQGQWNLVERRRVQMGNPDIKVQRAISSL